MKTTGNTYRPEIDGLRTIAVIPVILFHLNYSWIKGGYYGVDVFFVISGFLITNILIKQISTGNFSMREFWLRRIRRLVPALLVVVLATIVFGMIFLYRPYVKQIGADAVPAMLSYSNFHAFYNFGNYWGEEAENSFFLHTWSLSVEEQFYLIFPLLMILYYNFFKNFKTLLLIISGISFLFFAYQLRHNQTYAFYMLPCRVWELAAGGFISTLRKPKKRNVLPALGLLMILIPFFYDKGSISLHAVSPVLGTAILLRCTTSEDYVGRVLSSRIFTFIGRISYSMYLWHWPLIIFSRKLWFRLYSVGTLHLNISICILTFLLACASYYFVENKTRHKAGTSYYAIVAVGVLVGFSFCLHHFYNTDYKSAYRTNITYLRTFDISPTLADVSENPLYKGVSAPERPKFYDNAYKQKGIIKLYKRDTPDILLFGDSHGVMWAKTFREITDSLQVGTAMYTINGDKPFVDLDPSKHATQPSHFTESQRQEYADSLIKNLREWHPKLVIIACRWDNYPDPTLTLIKQYITYFAKRNIKVLFLTQPPKIPFFGNENASQYFSYLRLDAAKHIGAIPKGRLSEPASLGNSRLKNETVRFPNVSYFDAYSPLIKNNEIIISMDAKNFYFDDDHLSYYGTSYLKPLLANKLIQILQH